MDDKTGRQVLQQELLGRDLDITDTLSVNYWRFFKSSEIDRALPALVVNLKKKTQLFYQKNRFIGD